MRMMVWVSAMMAAYAAVAQAEPTEIVEALGKVTGTEVHITGQLGRLTQDYLLSSDLGYFHVEFAVDPATLVSVRDCKFGIMSSATDCNVDMLAELRAAGGALVLVAYQIKVTPPPKPAPAP